MRMRNFWNLHTSTTGWSHSSESHYCETLSGDSATTTTKKPTALIHVLLISDSLSPTGWLASSAVLYSIPIQNCLVYRWISIPLNKVSHRQTHLSGCVTDQTVICCLQKIPLLTRSSMAYSHTNCTIIPYNSVQNAICFPYKKAKVKSAKIKLPPLQKCWPQAFLWCLAIHCISCTMISFIITASRLKGYNRTKHEWERARWHPYTTMIVVKTVRAPCKQRASL